MQEEIETVKEKMIKTEIRDRDKRWKMISIIIEKLAAVLCSREGKNGNSSRILFAPAVGIEQVLSYTYHNHNHSSHQIVSWCFRVKCLTH